MRRILISLALASTGCSFVLDVDSVEPRCNAADECAEGYSCVDGVCERGERCEAVPNAAKRCSPTPGVGGDVRWFDSCGEPQDEIFEDCPDQNSECVETSDTVALCRCLNHWEGSDCTTCPGNWDAAQDCNACSGNWDPAEDCAVCTNEWVDNSNDCSTCPAGWDPASDCSACLGNWDPAQSCTVCKNEWVDNSDNCGTCPGNWDEASDCSVCLGNWDQAADCATCANHWEDNGDDCGTCPGNWDSTADCNVCMSNWDPAQDCSVCLGSWDPTQGCALCENEWVDSGDDCGTCPGNWDASANCSVCLGNWDAAQDCSVCANRWTDNGDDCGTCPGNWDAGADCDACVGNRDEAADCTTCLPGFAQADCSVCVRFVDVASAAGTPDGLSWATAFPTVAAGIADALFWQPAHGNCEVWVARGRYVETLSLPAAVPVMGGFLPGASSRGERDWHANPTVINGRVTAVDGSVLDGFVLADTGTSAYYNNAVTSTVRNTVFANPGRSGIWNIFGGSVTVEDCIFTLGGTDDECGIFSSSGSELVVNRSMFVGWNGFYGASICLYDGTATITGYVSAGNLNNAEGSGAGFFADNSTATIAHATIVANDGDPGEPGTFAGVFSYDSNTSTAIVNSILWGNDGAAQIDCAGSCTAATSNIQGGYTGTNIDTDPSFASAPYGSGTWTGVSYDNVVAQSALEDSAANWEPGVLAGLFIKPNANNARWAYIVGNTGTTLRVWGDATQVAAVDDTYELFDLRLTPTSGAVDSADASVWPGWDLFGITAVDVSEQSNTGLGEPGFVDMGAIELSNGCVGLPDFTLCDRVTSPDREYDICKRGWCVSPGCGDTSCNPEGPHFPIPDTGQVDSFNATATILPPGAPGDAACGATPFCGQDAQYGWDVSGDPSTRFTRDATVADEVVVTDTITGLVWQGCVVGLSGADCSTTVGTSTFIWQDAVGACENSDWAGFEDWRLPDRYELHSLANLGGGAVAIDTDAFPGTPADLQWTVSAEGSNNFGTFVSFVDGGTWGTTKTATESVRCVRGAPTIRAGWLESPAGGAPQPTDEAVVDPVQGLMWQRCTVGLSSTAGACTGTATTLVWQASLAECEAMSLAGYDDWRLPNAMELISVNVDDAVAFPGVQSTYVHSSSTPTRYPDAMFFGTGGGVRFVTSGPKKADSLRVRCVRDLP